MREREGNSMSGRDCRQRTVKNEYSGKVTSFIGNRQKEMVKYIT